MSFDNYDKIYCNNVLFSKIDDYLKSKGLELLSDYELAEIRTFLVKILEHLRKEEIEDELIVAVNGRKLIFTADKEKVSPSAHVLVVFPPYIPSTHMWWKRYLLDEKEQVDEGKFYRYIVER